MSDCDENNTYQNYYKPYCLFHTPNDCPEEISRELFYLIPQTGPKCCVCREEPACYLGYIDPDFSKYLPHLKHQLEYYNHYRNCVCYWPEYSKKAAEISDTAYLLFKDLISNTELSQLLENEEEQRQFVGNSSWLLSKHGLTIFFIVQQFRFSDYYHLCRDIEEYAKSRYDEREIGNITDKLDDILGSLYPQFFALYSSCYSKHPCPEIDQEIQFMKLLINDISGLEKTVFPLTTKFFSESSHYNFYDISEFYATTSEMDPISVDLENKGTCRKKEIPCPYFPKLPSKTEYSENNDLAFSFPAMLRSSTNQFCPQAEIFLEQGNIFNQLLLYKEAIQILSQAIQLNPSNRDAYIERAMAFFETDQLSLALKDYEVAKNLTIDPPFKIGQKNLMLRAAIFIPENKIEFSSGLISGILEGGKISVTEFIPSIFSSCQGILNGLWAFASSPKEVSQEIIISAYAIGEFLNTHTTEECLQCVVPELKELSLLWHSLDDNLRGQKIGFIIGKYGIDIFIPIGTFKIIKKAKALNRANTMYTLECCASSAAKQDKILTESIKRSTFRQILLCEGHKKGKIFIKNSNVQYHVMQKKHAWDKIIKLSGNVEEDFKKVVLLLEEQDLINKKFIHELPKHFPKDRPKIIRSDHKKFINNHEVYAVFETYTETEQIYLKDAWVITQ